MTQSPADLLRAAQAGDPEAAAALASALVPKVLSWCQRLSGPGIDAEDAAHDVLVTLLDNLDQIRRAERLESWLFTVTRRTLARRGRSRRLWVLLGALGVEPAYRGPSPEERSDQDQTSQRVRAVLAILPAPQREVLVLCDMEDRSAAEAAQLLGVSEGTVRSRLRLGRARFARVARQRALDRLVQPDTEARA